MAEEGKKMVLGKTDMMNGKMDEWNAASQAAANLIRKKSESGQLVLKKEIFQALMEQKVLKSDHRKQKGKFEAILKKTMEENGDLKELPDKDGLPRYYSSQCMSETYVRILLRKEENPLMLIAEIVRENSASYPRPTSLDTFKNSPFELTQEEILSCLQTMSDQKDYQDITQTTTSAGTVFLYSNIHLDPGYASMLAEWLDVGQFNNP
jgi:hypothetical protein